MDYYVVIGGKTEGPFPEEDVLQMVGNSEIERETPVMAVGSKEWTTAGSIRRTPPPRTPAPLVMPVVAKAPPRVPPAEALRKIRQRSCYGALRGVIEVVTVLLAIFTFAGVFGSAMTMASGKEDHTGVIVAAVIGGGISVVLIVALRQLALVAVDIADTLIATHARD